MALPKPSKKLIQKKAEELRKQEDTLLDLEVLNNLFKSNSSNTDIPTVLLKVTVLNELYSTRIFKVRDAARAIVDAEIDSLLDNNDPCAVKRIQTMKLGSKVRSTYSFATKYCSWHHPENYPIFDKNVMKALTAYRIQDKFAKFSQKDLRDYKKFIEILKIFRKYYEVENVSFSDLDKFLWSVGTSKILRN